MRIPGAEEALEHLVRWAGRGRWKEECARTDAARRYKRVANAEALIWKILMIAEKKFRRLNAPELLEQVYEGQ